MLQLPSQSGGGCFTLDTTAATHPGGVPLFTLSETGIEIIPGLVKFDGTVTLSQNLAVLLTALPTGLTVTNSSGTHSAGSPYLNFDTAIGQGGLAGGAISDAIRVEINNPNLALFSFKPVILQGAQAALPDLSSLATLTVKVGDKIDIPLQGELAIQTAVKLPTGAITGDSHLIFTPTSEQIGSYTFTLIARNGGTEVTQNITLNVVADPITTTRVTGKIADTNQAGLANLTFHVKCL